MDQLILHLGRPTGGDPGYYSRWREQTGLEVTNNNLEDSKGHATILVVDQYFEVNDKLLDILPKVKHVCSPTTGHTHLKFNAKDRGIELITLRGEVKFLSSITSVSEFTLYLLHRIARELCTPPIKLSGKNIAIIGKGRVGKYVGRVCRSIGMDVHYFDKRHNKFFLKDLLRQADFVSLHLSEGPTTRNFLKKSLIAEIKKGAYIINTARASVMDELAVHDAIRNGNLAGVATDVSPNGSPLDIVHPRIIRTPHIAGRVLEDRISTDEFIIFKLLQSIQQH